jgi:hypothetical protein
MLVEMEMKKEGCLSEKEMSSSISTPAAYHMIPQPSINQQNRLLRSNTFPNIQYLNRIGSLHEQRNYAGNIKATGGSKTWAQTQALALPGTWMWHECAHRTTNRKRALMLHMPLQNHEHHEEEEKPLLRYTLNGVSGQPGQMEI